VKRGKFFLPHNAKLAPYMLRPCVRLSVLAMRGISISEKYRGIKSVGIIYRGLAKYRPQHSTQITACR